MATATMETEMAMGAAIPRVIRRTALRRTPRPRRRPRTPSWAGRSRRPARVPAPAPLRDTFAETGAFHGAVLEREPRLFIAMRTCVLGGGAQKDLHGT